ncbi:MAG: hypothetical protein FRX49_03110 [Trebouxia sp. A1-2]|nr:MAG: hypothetical protein FRX49_03110 [Trebouxia sp. A1-2]
MTAMLVHSVFSNTIFLLVAVSIPDATIGRVRVAKNPRAPIKTPPSNLLTMERMSGGSSMRAVATARRDSDGRMPSSISLKLSEASLARLLKMYWGELGVDPSSSAAISAKPKWFWQQSCDAGYLAHGSGDLTLRDGKSVKRKGHHDFQVAHCEPWRFCQAEAETLI